MNLKEKFSGFTKQAAFAWVAANPAFVVTILGVIFFGILSLYLLGRVENWSMWRDARRDGENANSAAANANKLEGEREKIKEQANRDLEILNQQGSQTNANLNNSLNNLNRINNANFNTGSGSDLDRQADEYRKRPGRNNKW